ncbi:MAG TPA: hypothetical protein VNV65_10355 [Candidatus Solibacter sp.]|nr:hypothetical protein [Candidatus Solibacter sp.]
MGLAVALDRVEADALEQAADSLLDLLEPVRTELYRTPCEKHGQHSELAHSFWVRSVQCPGCSASVYLFPYSLITVASRRRSEKWGYFGCKRCGAVTRSGLTSDSSNRKCGRCRLRLSDQSVPLTPGRIATCSGCSTSFPAFADDLGPRWTLCLEQRLCGKELHFIANPKPHRDATGDPPAQGGMLMAEIPDGQETSVLRRAGFHRWIDLYPTRQVGVILEAARVVKEMRVNARVRRRLLLAICGTAEMAGYASRWDRYYPKAFEIASNHRFSVVGLSCETNLLGARGRGTLRRRLASSVKAARWVEETFPTQGAPRHLAAAGRRRALSGATVAVGSSERLLLTGSTADLVLTDPPYHDDVQYGELAALFFVWAQATGLFPADQALDLRREAVPNAVRKTDGSDYERLLTDIFGEAARVLKSDGRMILTFHNSDLRAWDSLAVALRKSGFKVTGLATALAENYADHSKRRQGAFTHDLVIECRTEGDATLPQTVTHPSNNEERELLAAGAALSNFCGGRSRDFRRQYMELCPPMERRLIRDGLPH